LGVFANKTQPNLGFYYVKVWQLRCLDQSFASQSQPYYVGQQFSKSSRSNILVLRSKVSVFRFTEHYRPVHNLRFCQRR
jgi:hypothetical protein